MRLFVLSTCTHLSGGVVNYRFVATELSETTRVTIRFPIRFPIRSPIRYPNTLIRGTNNYNYSTLINYIDL